MPTVNAVENETTTTKTGGRVQIINMQFPVSPYLPLPTVPIEGGLTKRPGGAWGARFSLHGKRYCIGGRTKEVTKKKLNLVLRHVNKGTFDGDIHKLLIDNGYPEGAYVYESGTNRAPKKKKKDREIVSKGKQPLRGSLRERTDGTYEARYTYMGQRFSLYAATEKEAVDKLYATFTSIADGSYIGKSPETFVGYMMTWINQLKKSDLAPTTLTAYEGYIRNHITPYFKNTKLQNISTQKLQDFIDVKYSEGRADGKSGGLSRKTILNLRNMMHSAMDDAVNPKKLIKYNPVMGVRLKTPIKKDYCVLSENDIVALMNKCHALQTPYAYAISILLQTGMRQGEILGLQYENIDLENRYIYVERQLLRIKHPGKHRMDEYTRIDTWAPKNNKTGIYLGPPKSQSSRRKIPISEATEKSILALMALQEKKFGVEFQKIPNHESLYLIERINGTPVDPSFFRQKFKDITTSLSLDINVHATRHTFATHLIRKAPGELATISAMLGHADQGTTLKYSHALEESMRQVIKLI